MAREQGGLAEKDGNEYERLWLAEQAINALMGSVSFLRWEPVAIGMGIDIELGLPGGQSEVQQCKIENRNREKWSIADLTREGVLDAAKHHIEAGRTFVFVSQRGAGALEDLCERSHRCDNDASIFANHSLSSELHRKTFGQLCHAWELDAAKASDLSTALQYLQQLRFERGIWSAQERHRLNRQLTQLVEDPTGTALAALKDYLQTQPRNCVAGHDIRSHLTSRGFRFFRLLPLDIASHLERLRRTFRDAGAPTLIEGALIPRRETAEVLKALLADDGPRLVLLHGAAGVGKSGVLLALERELQAHSIPCLPLRLDDYVPQTSLTVYYRDVLELPAEPGVCLASATGSSIQVLLVDQLDSLRWSAAHSETAFRVCAEMIDGALLAKGTRVVLACRTFDLEEDPQFRRWTSQPPPAMQGQQGRNALSLKVEPLSVEIVRGVVERSGGDYLSLYESERTLLTNPQHLYLWWDLATRQALPRGPLSRLLLVEAYWRNRLALLRLQCGLTADSVTPLVDRIVDYCDREGKTTAPRLLVGSDTHVLTACCSVGLLVSIEGRHVRFSHQSYLDHRIVERVAAKVLTGEQTVAAWVTGGEQSLLRRHQLRLLLELLRDQDPAAYTEALRGILQEPSIRFHLRHLVLRLLRSIDVPRLDEVDLIITLLETTSLRSTVISNTVLGNKAWFDELHRRGLWNRWLRSPESNLRDAALTCMRVMVESKCSSIAELLRPHWESGEPTWRAAIAQLLDHQDLTDTSSLLFQWHAALVRTGGIAADNGHVAYVGKSNAPLSVHMLAARLAREAEEALAVMQARGDDSLRIFDRYVDDATRKELADACFRAASEAWVTLVPVLERIAVLGRHAECLSKATDEKYRLRAALGQEALRSLTDVLLPCVTAAGGALWELRSSLLHDLLHIRGGRTSCVERVVCDILSQAPTSTAEKSITWLLDRTERYSLGDPQQKSFVEPARNLLRRHVSACAESTYARLEASLMRYHPRWETFTVSRQLEVLRTHNIITSNYFGRAQCVLLDALPEVRRSTAASRRLAEWRSKFGDPDAFRPAVWHSGAHTVRSTIPRERLGLLTNKTWLRLIATDWSMRERAGRLRDEYRGEASHGTFAFDFGIAAKAAPNRFLRLGIDLPASAPATYHWHLLNSVADSLQSEDASAERPDLAAIEDYLQHTSSQHDPEFARAVCRLVQSSPELDWSEATLERICAYAATHEDPTSGATTGYWVGGDKGVRDLDTTSINCVRGVACEALRALLFASPVHYARILAVAKRTCADPHPAVRVAATGLALPIYNIDKAEALRLFLACVAHDDEGVMAGHYVPYMLHVCWNRHFSVVAPLLRRMLKSKSATAREWAAYWTTAGYTIHAHYGELFAYCRDGGKDEQSGMARAYVDMTRETKWKDRCWEPLARLLANPSAAVSREAAKVFRSPDILASPTGPELALRFVEGPGYDEDPMPLLDSLDNYEGDLTAFAPTILHAIAKLRGSSSTRRKYRHEFMMGRELTALLLRLYNQAEGHTQLELRRQCLDAWDELLESDVYGVSDRIRQLDL